MVSFEVEEYPGPDNDPILTQGYTTQVPEVNINDMGRSPNNTNFKLKVKENSNTSSLSMKKNMKRVNSARKLSKHDSQ